jgi:DNA polymerase elongation subunit (family B)
VNNRYVLVSSFYDGKLKKVGLKFYDTVTDQIRVVFANTGFLPYFISLAPRQELEKLRNSVPSIVKLSPMSLIDPLTDKAIEVTKVVVDDPLAISGSQARGKVGLRDIVDAHEADIRTYLNFLYDTKTVPGTYFDGDDGQLVPSTFKTSEGADRLLAKVLATPGMTDEAKQVFTEWVALFDQPIPKFKVLALDIETWNEQAYKVPNPEVAIMPIIAVSLVGDGGVKEVHVYTKGKHPHLERDFGIVYHATEKLLLAAVLKRIEEYPFLVTFNGDAFDLTYIQNRAKALGLKTPFKVKPGKKPKDTEVSLKVGIHIDLYKFHSNKSVANYVYEGRYHEFTLDAISEALLGEGKVEIPTKGDMSALTYEQLIDYSIQDSILTHRLASRQSQLALKMLVLFSRTSMMPMDDISRHGISTWIKSMLYYQMKKRNLLIPNRKDLESKGGASTTAIIKGKQYQGAIVVDPVPGVYFDVKVLDFASLYPTSIRNWNLSFDTVNCTHEECKANIIPGTQHWSCKKKIGVISLMIGALRDLRVLLYKPLSKINSATDDERDTANTIAQSLKVYLNACFTGDTGVITPTGIKNIKEMKVGDEVLNVNPESLRVERDLVVEVQRFGYHGPLYHFKNKRFLDLMVTPNHRMLVTDIKSNGSTALFLTAEEVYNTTNMSIPRVGGAIGQIGPGLFSLLPSAQRVGAFAIIYSGGERLSNWFRKLPHPLQSKIRRYGIVYKAKSDRWSKFGSCYKVPSKVVTEDDIDTVKNKGGIVMLGMHQSSKVFARVDAIRFAQLCGWVVSEGSLYTSKPRHYVNGHTRGKAMVTFIAQSPGAGNPNGESYRKQITAILEEMNIQYSSNSRGFYISNGIIHDFIAENCYVAGVPHTAAHKKVPRFVFEDPSLAYWFFSAAYRGDGTRRQALYTTKSKRLAEEVTAICCLLGCKVSNRFDAHAGVYRVSFSRSGVKLTRAALEHHRYVSKVQYDGLVYCVTTKRNHTVIAGRNGKFAPVGQSYGVTGFAGFGLFCVPVAESTAAVGRDAITRVQDKCKELGMRIIGGDTDSIFIHAPTDDQLVETIKWAHDVLRLDLEIDKTYKLALLSSRKKNYLGVLLDGKPVIKGLTGKKSNNPPYIREAFMAAVNDIVNIKTVDDVEPTKKKLMELATERYRKLSTNEVQAKELAVHMKMTAPIESYTKSTPQHVQAAKFLVEAGRDVQEGDTITFVKVKPQKLKRDDNIGDALLDHELTKEEKKARDAKISAKPLEFVENEEIDYDKYKGMFISTFAQIFDPLSLNLDDESLSPPQTKPSAQSLDAFWD